MGVAAAPGGGHAADACDPDRRPRAGWRRLAGPPRLALRGRSRRRSRCRSCRSRARRAPAAGCAGVPPRAVAPCRRRWQRPAGAPAEAQPRRSCCGEEPGSLVGACARQDEPSRAGRPSCADQRRSTLAAMPWQTDRRCRSCVVCLRPRSLASAPAEPHRRGRGGEGARRQARGWLGQVEAGGRDVVGGVGVEERGEVLDLAAPDAQLELAAAVVADSRARRRSRRRRAGCAGRRGARA